MLFTKGVSGPLGASVQEVKEGSGSLGPLRHPITGLEQSEGGETIGKGMPTTATTPASVSVTPVSPTTPAGATAPDPARPMTQEEKEIEAERLMTLFQRMERNPAMSMMSGDNKVPNPMREMVDSGRMRSFEKDEAERERKRVEAEEGEDEEQALRELAQYKKRVKRV